MNKCDKQAADAWYASYYTTHKTQQNIQRMKDYHEKFGKVVKE